MSINLSEMTGSLTEKILSLGEHIRLQAHLAGMEANESWDTLARDVQGALQRLSGATSKVGEVSQEGRYQAQLALLQAKDGWQSLKEQVEKAAKAASDGTEPTDQAVRETKDTLLRETQALLERLEDGVKSLSEAWKH